MMLNNQHNPEYQSVDLVLKHGTVITMDPDRRILEDGAVAVNNGRIVAVGKTDELEALYQAARTGGAADAAADLQAGIAQGPGHRVAGVQAGGVLPADPVHGPAMGIKRKHPDRRGLHLSQGRATRQGCHR